MTSSAWEDLGFRGVDRENSKRARELLEGRVQNVDERAIEVADKYCDFVLIDHPELGLKTMKRFFSELESIGYQTPKNFRTMGFDILYYNHFLRVIDKIYGAEEEADLS